jgi:hypothetical protein
MIHQAYVRAVQTHCRTVRAVVEHLLMMFRFHHDDVPLNYIANVPTAVSADELGALSPASAKTRTCAIRSVRFHDALTQYTQLIETMRCVGHAIVKNCDQTDSLVNRICGIKYAVIGWCQLVENVADALLSSSAYSDMYKAPILCHFDAPLKPHLIQASDPSAATAICVSAHHDKASLAAAARCIAKMDTFADIFQNVRDMAVCNLSVNAAYTHRVLTSCSQVGAQIDGAIRALYGSSNFSSFYPHSLCNQMGSIVYLFTCMW